MRINPILAAVCLAAAASHAMAQTEMTINTANGYAEQWGTSRTERYDVAFRLADSSLSGCGIDEIRVPFVAASATSGHTIWVSSTLSLENGANSPDIIQLDASLSDGSLSARFPENVTIPSGECFIGFSFSVDELTDESKKPVTVVVAAAPGDLYVHSSRKFLKWGTQNLSLTPRIFLSLTGGFHRNALAVETLPETGGLRNASVAAYPVVRNHGSEPIRSIDCEITSNGLTTTRHIDFPSPLPCDYFADVTLDIGLDSDLTPGGYPFTLTVSKVNGEDNPDAGSSAASEYFIYPYLPEKTPLMEEYTGTWCGWCPRGIVGMDRMSELYPAEFVYAVYHRGDDPMNTVEELATPYDGAPSGYIDRVVAVDPFNGTSKDNVPSVAEGIELAWKYQHDTTTTGMVEVSASWTDDSKSEFSVTAKSTFIRDYSKADFKMAYIVTADGLHGEGKEWEQSNYFSGLQEYASTELSELVGLPGKIAGMSYDGVVVLSSPLKGIEGSIPAEISMEESMTHTCSFNIDNARNYLGDSLPIDKDRLHVIAAIVDSATGEIVNCCRCDVTDGAGMDSPPDTQPVISVADGCVMIAGIPHGSSVSLHTPDGILVLSEKTLSGDNLSIRAGKGLHILSINGKSHKILVP